MDEHFLEFVDELLTSMGLMENNVFVGMQE